MKHFIRSVKYMMYFIVLCGLLLSLTFYTSTRPAGIDNPLDLLMMEGSWWKMLLFFVVFSAVYPLLGFQKKEIYVTNFADNKKEIIALFLNANFVVENDSATTITFRIKNKFLRLIRMYEDRVTVDFSQNPVIIDGLRKDTLRFSRGIEYICQKGNE